MLKLATLSINRRGFVSWHVTGENHCGPKALLVDGHLMPVAYDMTAVCEASLDVRGFLFDQASVDLWMARRARQPTTLSCERLVIETAEAFMVKIAKDVPTCKLLGLRLRFQPAPTPELAMAGVTARFGKVVD